jgi:predicted DCC family thiol-disulfide oxidoreductase YuxK
MSGQTRLTVYYDGACPVCSREMGFYQRQAGADDIQWVDVATCDPGLLAPQLDLGSRSRDTRVEFISSSRDLRGTDFWRVSMPRRRSLPFR